MSGCLCNNHTSDIINRYLSIGWPALSEIFVTSTKETTKGEKILRGNKCVNESLLILIGAVRIYTVENFFNCSKKKDDDASFIAFGSTNILSDYDITILGKNAPSVVWKMFRSFFKMYGNAPAYTFDTNLYCNGYYLNKNINKSLITKITTFNKYCIVNADNKEDINIELTFAFLKLNNINTTLRNINEYFDKSRQLKDKLTNIYNTQYNLNKNKKAIQLDIYTKYNLLYRYSKKVYDILYGNSSNNISKLQEYICHANYFSIEAYNNATTAVVVVQMQGKYNIQLQKHNYICSVIENLGDFLHHVKSYKSKDIKIALLKQSKYIYRIFYSIGKIKGYSKYMTLAKRINKDVVAYRGNLETKRVDYALLNYKKNMSLQKYCDNLETDILNVLERLLE